MEIAHLVDSLTNKDKVKLLFDILFETLPLVEVYDMENDKVIEVADLVCFPEDNTLRLIINPVIGDE